MADGSKGLPQGALFRVPLDEMRRSVQIDAIRCKGCGRCVGACPSRLLSLETSGTKKCAVLARSELCDDCGCCASACPYAIIRMNDQPPATDDRPAAVLPWVGGTVPLMLAPMQGLTNRALRGLFAEWVRPDVLFTEFMRVKTVGTHPLSGSDLREVNATEQGIPLVVERVGPDAPPLVAAVAHTGGAAGLAIVLAGLLTRLGRGRTAVRPVPVLRAREAAT